MTKHALTVALPSIVAASALVLAGCGGSSSSSASHPSAAASSAGGGTASTAPASSTAAAGSSAATSTAAASTAAGKTVTGALHVPFFDDMGVPDPDIFYGAEGLMVTNGVYDSLLQYAPGSTKVVPDVAELPTVSSDGLTYTFALHKGITFHDGTALDSAAVAASFARRTALNQGPSY